MDLDQTMLAARQQDPERRAGDYRDIAGLELTVDGLQAEKGHETFYVVRELRRKRVWFAEPLPASATQEVRRLVVLARQWAARLDTPVRGWMSDQQAAFVTAIAAEFPGPPHRYGPNHFLRDVAQPVLELDRRAKVKRRSTVRGWRAIERRVLADRRHTAAPEPPPLHETPNTAEAPAPAPCTSTAPARPTHERGIPGRARRAGSQRASAQRGRAASPLKRLAGCMDRGLDVVRMALRHVGHDVKDLPAVESILQPSDEATGEEREEQCVVLREAWQASADPMHQQFAQVMSSVQPGVFVGGEAADFPEDNLDVERWFKRPKGHEHRIHGRHHAGVRIVQQGPTLMLALDAPIPHDGPLTVHDLQPYGHRRVPASQRQAVTRGKIMRKARSRKQRCDVLADLEKRYLNSS